MGRKSRLHAEKRLTRERAERRDAKRTAEAAAGPPLPAKRSRAEAEAPEEGTAAGIKSGIHAHPPLVPQPAPLKLVFGERPSSDRDPEDLTWTCECGKTNYPHRGLIADIPVLRCTCSRESDIEFDFSMANVTINNQSPIIKENIKKQTKGDCLLAATSSTMEVTLQMRTILSGEEFKGKETIINRDELDIEYERVRKLPGVNKDEKPNDESFTLLASIAKHRGVITDEGVKSKMNKLPEYVRVNLDFHDIVPVLADGNPLTSAIYPGKNFSKLKAGQIYKAPRPEKIIPGKHDLACHAIVLIGAGRKGKTNYYHFLNSWGSSFCLEEESGRYGFGMLRASDLLFEPVKFIRYQEEL